MGLLSNSAGFKVGFYEQKGEMEKKLGRKLSYKDFAENYYKYGGGLCDEQHWYKRI